MTTPNLPAAMPTPRGIARVSHTPMPAAQRERDFLVLVKAYSLAYHMDPYLMAALAETEGSGHGQRFRFGRVGRYWLPFGIYHGWKVPRADTPGGNAEAGIKAMARHLRKYGSLRVALAHYNTGDKGERFERYYKRVLYLARQNRDAWIFE